MPVNASGFRISSKRPATEAFTGMASQQVADYLATVVRPALEAHAADRTSHEEEVRV